MGAEHALVDRPEHRLLVPVVVHHEPSTLGRLLRGCELRAVVELAVVGVYDKPVAEHPMAHDLRAVGSEDVQVRARVGESQAAVLVPPGLADDQDEAGALEGGDIRRFVGWIRHGEIDVDDGLRREASDGGRPDVLDPDGGARKPSSDHCAAAIRHVLLQCLRVTKSIAMIVAGEVGPTDTRLALCGLDAGRPVVVAEETARSSATAGLAPMVQKFLRKYRPPQVRAAAFVVGGPVHEGKGLAPGLPWPVAATALAAELSMDRVTLLTDVEGMAHALAALPPEERFTLSAGDAPESGNQLVVGAGGSAGVAGLYWNGTEHRCFASEAGSADFAPGSEEERGLAQFLSARVERVTVGLLLSRAGLALIHAYVSGTGAAPGEDVPAADPTTGTDADSRRAVEIFLRAFGSIAANLALSLRATGGVYLGGDVVLALRAQLTSGGFMAAFCRKPPLEALLQSIPVHAVLNPNAALLGAATVAARELRTQRGSGWAS